MDERNELIHEIRNFLKVWWNMTSNVDGLFSEAPAKLRNPRDSDMVQSPQRVFIESGWALLQTNFYKGREKIILPSKVLLLKSGEEVRIFFLPHQHQYARTRSLGFVSLASCGIAAMRCAQIPW